MQSPSTLRCLHPGEVVAGKYRVLNRLGGGSFGEVFSAENVNLGTQVAIKVSRRPGADDRTWREARAAARLCNPHTVRVFDVDRLEDGTPYIVMERLEGQSLRSYLKEHSRVSIDLALAWTLQLCAALGEAHAARLIHRDLKPSNIFLVPGADSVPSVKLLDFGLAKTLDIGAEETLTESNAVMGSPAYMSPEQLQGAPATASSDIWSLGVILYEMLAGQRPFGAQGGVGVWAAIVTEPPRPLSELRPDLPPGLEALVRRCLRKVALERPPSVENVALELQALRNSRGAADDLPGEETESGVAPFLNASSTRSRRPSSWFGGAVFCALLLVALSWILMTERSPRPSSDSSAVPAEAAPAEPQPTSLDVPVDKPVLRLSPPEPQPSDDAPIQTEPKDSPPAPSAPPSTPSQRQVRLETAPSSRSTLEARETNPTQNSHGKESAPAPPIEQDPVPVLFGQPDF